MPAPPRRRTGRRGASPLSVRLALVVMAVAIVSVVVFATIVYLVDRSDVQAADRQQQQSAAAGIAAAAAAAYQAAGGWAGADLTAIEAVAANDHLGVRITTPDGATPLNRAVSGPSGAVTNEAIRVGKVTVARLTVTAPARQLSAADERLRLALERSLFAAALVAASVALVSALLMARRLTRPIRDLTGMVRRHGAGQPAAPETLHPGPGEIGELSRAFTAMISDLDRHEQLRRSLVADIAHELRTPIAVLQGETEALIDGVTELTPAAAQSLHEEVLRLGRLVEDLQTLAAAQAAGLDMHPRRLDLAEVAKAAGESQRRARHDAGLSWDADLHPATVHGDPLRLHQVVTNLLTNAIKYTPAGGQVRLTVRTEGTTAVLEVQDTGPGIPDHDLPKVFDRFWRGSNGAVAGRGIGLAVSAELVAAHHGTIEITTPPLGGTRATVRLPLAG